MVNVSGNIVIFLCQLFGELNCLCGCTFFELNLSFDCVNVNVTCQVSCLFLNENFLFIFLLAFYYLWSINYHVWNAMRGSFSWVGAAEHYVYAGIFSRCCYIFWCWQCGRIRFFDCWKVCLFGAWLSVYYSMTVTPV